LSSAVEIAQSLKELNEIPDIANLSKLSGINCSESITHYGRLWTDTQAVTSPIEVTDADLPAGPAVRFHNSYWHKSRLPIVIDLPSPRHH
jgi:hypothetical protein